MGRIVGFRHDFLDEGAAIDSVKVAVAETDIINALSFGVAVVDAVIMQDRNRIVKFQIGDVRA